MHTINRRLAGIAFALLIAASTARAQFVQTNIVSDIPGMAPNIDPNLNNPWGVSFTNNSPFWVSDQASVFRTPPSSVATLYNINGQTGTPVPLIVNIPTIGGAPPDPIRMGNGPTGQVTPGAVGITTTASDFPVAVGGATGKANFIFANLDGSISAWNNALSGTQATIQATVPGASFTGLAIGNNLVGGAQLYAADQNSASLSIFNSQWGKTGTFTDPNLPAGFTAFNVQNLGGTLFVTFANQANPLGGIVDEFNTDGTLIKRLVTDPTGVHLDQPWGLAIAPPGFGQFGGDLLVGNNAGNNWVNAYNLTTGANDGVLTLASGQPFSEGDLWSLSFGSGAGGGGSANTLYFTAGLGSQVDGLFGALTPAVPEPSSFVLGLFAVAALGLSTLGYRAFGLVSRRAPQA